MLVNWLNVFIPFVDVIHYHPPTSLSKSVLIILICRYKKSVETCHAYHIVGIAKHHCKNKQKQIPHAVVYTLQSTAGAVRAQSYTYRMDVSLSLSSYWVLAISLFRIKQETHSWPKDFSPRMLQIYKLYFICNRKRLFFCSGAMKGQRERSFLYLFLINIVVYRCNT